MSQNAYGGTVSQVEPKHLASIAIPIGTDAKRRDVHQKIVDASRLRDEATDLSIEAHRAFHEALGLPTFSTNDIEYIGSSGDPKAFWVDASELGDRFDASYHVPIVRGVLRKLGRGTHKLVSLGETDTTVRRPSRFRRVYVSRERGVPFLQPSHLAMFRPMQYRSLSPVANSEAISQCGLREGMILVSRSGTAGLSMLVTKWFLGWAASDDLLRVEVGAHFDAGFLAAFLGTAYAKHQLLGQLYGGVIDHIDEPHVRNLQCPDAPVEVQRQIGDLIRAASAKKDEANDLEDAAVHSVEALIAGVSIEEYRNQRVARQRLAEIAADPTQVVRGEELARRMDTLI